MKESPKNTAEYLNSLFIKLQNTMFTVYFLGVEDLEVNQNSLLKLDEGMQIVSK